MDPSMIIRKLFFFCSDSRYNTLFQRLEFQNHYDIIDIRILYPIVN